MNINNFIIGQKILEDYLGENSSMFINRSKSTVVYRGFDFLDTSVESQLTKLGWTVYRGTAMSSVEFFIDNFSNQELIDAERNIQKI